VRFMDDKAILHSYLRTRRADLLGKLDGLSEYDARRPMTPTGTHLLGLVKPGASVELGHLGHAFGRPSGEVGQNRPADLGTLYVPTRPNPTSGFMLMGPRADVVALHMSVDEALKYIISMGVVAPPPSAAPGSLPPSLPTTGPTTQS